VAAARAELERLGVAHRRPDDFFAEMLKSDEHMQKVRSAAAPPFSRISPPCARARCPAAAGPVLTTARAPAAAPQIKDKVLTEQRKMSAVESRRKQRDNLKHVKEVASERIKAKAAEKRAHTDTLKQWKRHRGDAEHAGASRERALEAAVAPPGRGGGGAGGSRAPPRPGAQSFRRKGKESKYGHGGQKRYLKDNTARSSGDFRAFSASRNKELPPGLAHKGKKVRAAAARRRPRVRARGAPPPTCAHALSRRLCPLASQPKNAGAARPGKRSRASMHSKRS